MTASKTAPPPALAGKRGFSLIPDEKFRQLYTALLQCQMLDQRLCSVDGYEPWAGRLAASAAVAACLRRGDAVMPTPRGMLAGYLHSSTITLTESLPKPAAQLTAANQDAQRRKLENRGGVVAVFARADKRASTSKAFSAAAGKSLPILYVLQGATPPADSCAGIPVIRVDSSDTIALYRVAYESITRARDGGGPTILECAPWPADSEPANPLLKLEHYLAARKLFRPHWKRQLESKYAAALDEAVSAVRRVSS